MGTTMQSVAYNACDSPMAMQSCGSGKMLCKRSLSFEGRQLDSSFSFQALDNEERVLAGPISPASSVKGKKSNDSPMLPEKDCFHPCPKQDYKKHDAAVKLQKVYKSFRTRRQLADCAVVVEQRWWKLLDFAELKRRSISFFDIEKPETAISKWSRVGMTAAKVGKGLSKDARARKLALQHWLEAVDPRHRYGHNLQFYYVRWLHCQSKQPFFYWLDIGDGKEVNHERCTRHKLQQQCIKYLGPAERKAYEVVIVKGRFVYKQSGTLLHTTDGANDSKWIFVLSASKTLYIGQKTKGTFQHSSFLAGGATLSAGRLIVQNGLLKAVWPHSGHYLPTEENFEEFIRFLGEHDVDLTSIKKNPTEDEEAILLACSQSQETEGETTADDSKIQSTSVLHARTPKMSCAFRSKLSKLEIEIPRKDEMVDIFLKEAAKQSINDDSTDYNDDEGNESAEDSFFNEEDFMFPKMTLFDEDESEDDTEEVPREKILRRIDSHKGMNSYQLARQLSSRWTTGAGPRIGCMRDYPSELQCWVLEHANLSPKSRHDPSSPRGSCWSSPRVQPPTALTPVALFDNKSSKPRSRLREEQARWP